MKVLIIDDSHVWIREGKRLLESVGHVVMVYLVQDPEALQRLELLTDLLSRIDVADVVMTDKDLGAGLDSTLMLCVIRALHPKKPLIRWTGGYESGDELRLLGVSRLSKPTMRKDRDGSTLHERFPEMFAAALAEQQLILEGGLAVFRHVCEQRAGKEDGEQHGDSHRRKQHDLRLRQLSQIVKLAEPGVDLTPVLDEYGEQEYNEYRHRYHYWQVEGDSVGTTLHELGHAICDGVLTPEEITPFLPSLKKVVEKLEHHGSIDERFRVCADFILSGRPAEEVVLVQGCY